MKAGSSYTTIDVPGAPQSYLWGINDTGQMVGMWSDTRARAFVKDGSTFTTFNYGSRSYAYAINDPGKLVGVYFDGRDHGYSVDKNGSNFVAIDFPGAINTQAAGINDAGQIVGIYDNHASGDPSPVITHGFLKNGLSFAAIDFPGAVQTRASGINDAGQIVGSYSDGSRYHGSLKEGSSFTTIDYPGAARTECTAINQSGQIVGVYTDSAGRLHGFLAIPSTSNHIVTNTNDSGPGSLRQAITDANASSATDHTIVFHIPTTDPGYAQGVFTIKPRTDLPILLDHVTIDGTTQTAFTGNTNPLGPEIVLNGSLDPNGNGLRLRDNNTVTGLVINGFAGDGISLSWYTTSHTAMNNRILNNYIGTDPTGTSAMPNTTGINLVGFGSPGGQAQFNVFQGNLISGNLGNGIGGGDFADNRIVDNRIGTARDGVGPLGNGGNGIVLAGAGAPRNLIESNTIAYNGGNGILDAPDYNYSVALTSSGHQGNAFLRNSIFANGRLGIDLMSRGAVDSGLVTLNDTRDTDQGANLPQNFPVLNSAISWPSSAIVAGTLNSSPNTTFHIELFASTSLDPTGYGEGQTYLDSTSVTTDGAGNASFSVTLSMGGLVGRFLSATATDPANNTSEFSRGRAVTAPVQVNRVGPVTPTPRNSVVSTVNVVFSRAIELSTLTAADITLTRDGALVSASGITVSLVSGSTYRLSGLDPLTTAQGRYVLIVNASGVLDLSGFAGTGSASTTWDMDTTSPTITNLSAATPNPRLTSVSTVDVTFSEPINLATFTYADISLARDGSPVTLTAAVTTPKVSGSTYRISGLAGFTTLPGTYTLTVSAAGVSDLAGNAGTGSASRSWVTTPALSLKPVTPVVEGQTAVLTGTVTNPPNHPFTLAIAWGDGRSDTLNLPAGSTSFTGNHLYLDDNPTGTASDVVTVTATLNVGAVAVTATVNVTIRNVAPTVFAHPAANVALNRSAGGLPSPLESDPGWGGGARPWDLLDGIADYGSDWAHGLAFTGGSGNWAGQPAGPRQATIAFGLSQTFDKVVIWHHGDDHVPLRANLDYWNGSSWVPIAYTRALDTLPGSTSSARSDVYTFAPVAGSKVRYSFDNRDLSILGSQIVHGWIYEFEVWSSASKIVLAGPTLSSTGSFTDPGLLDTFTATVNYGDGTGVQALILDPYRSFRLSHTYAAKGTYTVTVKVTDDDTGVGSSSFQVVVNSTSLTASTLNASIATAPGAIADASSLSDDVVATSPTRSPDPTPGVVDPSSTTLIDSTLAHWDSGEPGSSASSTPLRKPVRLRHRGGQELARSRQAGPHTDTGSRRPRWARHLSNAGHFRPESQGPTAESRPSNFVRAGSPGARP